MFAGSISRAVTQAEKARGTAGARPSSRATPSTSSSYGVRLRPQDTPLHRRRPGSPAGQTEAADETAESAGSKAEAKPLNAQEGARQTPKAKPVYTPISLDHEELPEDSGEESWTAQDAQGPAVQDVARPAQEASQAMSQTMSLEAGQEGGREGALQEAGQTPKQDAAKDAGALPWEVDEPESGVADQRAGAGQPAGKSPDGLDARGLFGQNQAGDEASAEPESGEALPWEQKESAAAEARSVDARGLFGQDQAGQEANGDEGPIDTKTFFTRAGAEDLRIDYGSEQTAESEEAEDGKGTSLPEGFGMFQDDGPAVSLERLASAQSAAGSDASLPKLRRAGQAKAAEPARPEPPLDHDRPKIRRSQAPRQEQTADQTPRQGDHEGRVYRDARRAR
ncbi:MAG: hypothetical protein IK061_00280, partial [Desulfovibrio sp.]|nr:hypothetical protein [Desulfovibrio sp.]